MNDNKYLIVAANALPEVFHKVVEAKELLKQGKAKGVTEAAKIVGISRSTFYKYSDFVFTLEDGMRGNKVTVAFVLAHESGVLSHLLDSIAMHSGNVLTLSQEAPINGVANVNVTFDISDLIVSIDDLIGSFRSLKGVVKAKLISME